MKKNFKSCNRFTLVELLVLVLIIVALTALLLPSMMNAVNSSRQASCSNNLRQVTLAQFNYAGDNHDWNFIGWCKSYWPAAIFGVAISSSLGFTQDYTSGNRDIAYCPTQYPYKYPGSVTSGASGSGSSFGINIQIESSAPIRQPRSIPATTYTSYFKISSIKSPSCLPWFTDTCVAGSNWQSHDQIGAWHPLNWINSSWQRGLHLRHFSTANTAFIDGHVTALSLERMDEYSIKKVILADYEMLDLP